MKRFTLIAAAILVALAAAVTVLSQDNTEQADETMRHSGSDELFRKYRDGNLDRREFDDFIRRLSERKLDSYLECSAARYLESEGFREITLHGLQKLAFDSYREPKPYQIASVWPKMYALELVFEEPLPPGVYWAKVHSLSLEILDKNGKIHNFGVKELDQAR